ncbi:MAG: hypothetical protein OIN84_09960 [Candidatus Methanoperedens sp.]|nr:hypothetical protein [Candidatus Methanoperedens sp. BLZ2]KAB2944911.1 MAG: hypothetical protein F9K14_12790 [Candidatus Methanoperedens sp.]MBZ0173787.1 hypothetical protein [Candidatus Methanoperedens nitroreducens]MCX9078288.1 hypothetical protein [Candidatus Methanoperedens sp.]
MKVIVMSNNRIGNAAGILFWVLLLTSALYIYIKGIRNYADVPIYLAALRIIEFFGLIMGIMVLILFFIVLIAIILTLFRPHRIKPNGRDEK